MLIVSFIHNLLTTYRKTCNQDSTNVSASSSTNPQVSPQSSQESSTQQHKRLRLENEPQESLVKKHKQANLKVFGFEKISEKQQQDIDESLCMFLFTSNLPLSLIENPAFTKLLNTLRPGYQIATIENIKTNLLQQCAQKVKSLLACTEVRPATLIVLKSLSNKLKFLAAPSTNDQVFIKESETPADDTGLFDLIASAIASSESVFRLKVEVIMFCEKDTMNWAHQLTSYQKYLCCGTIANNFINKLQDTVLIQELLDIITHFQKNSEIMQLLEEYLDQEPFPHFKLR